MKTKSLREARKKKEVTIRALSQAAGVSIQMIVHYESGRCNPSDGVFDKMKEHLKLSGKYEDWFTRKIVRKYGDDAVCAKDGCKRRPVSNGFCMTHYISEWRKAKRRKERKAEETKKTAPKASKKLTKAKTCTKAKKTKGDTKKQSGDTKKKGRKSKK